MEEGIPLLNAGFPDKDPYSSEYCLSFDQANFKEIIHILG